MDAQRLDFQSFFFLFFHLTRYKPIDRVKLFLHRIINQKFFLKGNLIGFEQGPVLDRRYLVFQLKNPLFRWAVAGHVRVKFAKLFFSERNG